MAVSDHEDTIVQRVTPDIVWEIRDSVPHGGIYAGIPAIFGHFLPKLQADFYDWHAQPDACIDAGATIVALGHYSGILKTNGVHIVAPFCHSGHARTGRSRAYDNVLTRPHSRRRCHGPLHNLWQGR
jgi:hypothetical protein